MASDERPKTDLNPGVGAAFIAVEMRTARAQGPSATIVDIFKITAPFTHGKKLRASVRAADPEVVEVRIVGVQFGRRDHVQAGVEAEVVDHLRRQDGLGKVFA